MPWIRSPRTPKKRPTSPTMNAWQRKQHLAEIIDRSLKNAGLDAGAIVDTAHHKQALYINGKDACGTRIYPRYFSTRIQGEKIIKAMKACKMLPEHQFTPLGRARTKKRRK